MLKGVLQSRLFQNEDMSCGESTEKLLPYGAATAAYGHSCMRDRDRPRRDLLCCSPRSRFSAWLFCKATRPFSREVSWVMPSILHLIFCFPAKIAGGRFIYARGAGVRRFFVYRALPSPSRILLSEVERVCTPEGPRARGAFVINHSQSVIRSIKLPRFLLLA